jgi:hypothetical protein
MIEPDPPDSTLSDLIDSTAELLPVEMRVGYYREMQHLHSLPENDEMLRILKITIYNNRIALGVPERLAAEREKLDRVLRDSIEASQQVHQRLDRLSDELVGRVSAEAIANKLYESLRQQFVKSAIPQTGQALAVVAGKIKGAVIALDQTTPKIVAAHKHAALEAQDAIREMKCAISEVTATARQATAELSRTFLHEYRWALGVLLVLALVLGFLFGIFLERSGYLPTFEPTRESAPAASPRTTR